ncbi:thiamine phosphate synthase [Sphingomonas sp. Leaf343]|uniref:thiamine phosphate synthase n=1 Tax=Sphingomonas sp. Leaf343 TaxID=1736345 RepID=UPI0006F99B78|nr:thiamine phosphate synthase [Sphingomonas sp. Leaf343]KQR83605.1 thiamine monophosphate synthase [Sphingomonas sp. Leaf343]
MRSRYPAIPPIRWLMTDERLGDGLWRALRRLPPGSGVVFRHHGMPVAARRALFAQVRRVTRARRLMLIVAGSKMAGALRHGRAAGAYSWPVHDRTEALAARRAGAKMVMVSPVFPTRSHPGAGALGPAGAARIGRLADAPVIALGGMTERRWRRIARLGFAGWAAIDAWAG